MTRRRKSIAVLGGVGLALASVAFEATTSTAPVLAVSACSGPNLYARAQSGTGTTAGTRMLTDMPANYYAPKNTGTDEAAWLINWPLVEGGYADSAVELGWFQGIWDYTTSDYMDNFAYPQGYETEDGGGYPSLGWVETGQLPASTQLQFQIVADGGGDDIGTSSDPTKYAGYDQNQSVTAPRTNMSQGEVAGGAGAWMGGNSGNGTTSYGYFESSSGSWGHWGSYTVCENSPYWITSLSSYSWKNGGK